MSTDHTAAPPEIREVAVVGLGTMGAGIAEVLARSGRSVVAVEANHTCLARGLAMLHASLDKTVARGRLSHTGKAEIVGRIRAADSIAAGAAGADLVIEAVPERMDLKQAVFAELDQACRADAILATNTSSLSVTALAAATRRPARVVGLHFFNPAPVMKLVEVISTVLTAPGTPEALDRLVRDLGKTPVQAGDRAGFVANPLLLPYLNQAVHLLETGYATREDIDEAATGGLGLPMGPLALVDLIGLDTSLSVLQALHAEFGGSRYAPTPLLRRMAEAGLAGRKSGRGFYDYRTGGVPAPAAADLGGSAASASPPATVALVENGAPAMAADLAGAITAAGIGVVRHPAPEAGLVLVAAEPGRRVLDAALATGRPADVVGIHLDGREEARAGLAELVVTHLTAPAAAAAAAGLAAKLGLATVTSRDRPGFLTAAICYPQLNDAVRMAQDGYATPADIDTAMMLGCGYPRGPLQMLDDIGPARVLDVLSAMHASTGDPAFAPALLLAEYAAAGTPFRGSGAG
jgi:3-hydroxybutyryl-CoA dehydrogenase